ncbi:MAG: methyltransferase, partial [Terriglobia bacterium]
MGQPEVHITSRGIDRIAAGHPWIYRSDVKSAEGLEPGAVVRVLERKGRFWGQALWSDKSQIALRMLTREQRVFDRAFLSERI